MPVRPEVVVFDVNETLTDMRPLAARFAAVGAPEHLLPTWFASVLRDGFGLAAAGSSARFGEIGTANLRTLLAEHVPGGASDEAVQHVLAGFPELSLHPDVADGMRALRDAGIRMITLTNGAIAMSEQVFARAGVADLVERFLSVDDAGVWKPAPGSYRYAAEQAGADPGSMALVAVHPWDVDGAKRAGLQGAWLARRTNEQWPAYYATPDWTAATLPELAAAMTG